MQIREFDHGPVDYDAVVRLANTIDPERKFDAEGLREWDEEYRPPQLRRRFLALDAGRLLGYGQFEHRHNMFDPQRFWVLVEVLPEHRRQGIGSRLFEHMQGVLIAEYKAKELHTTCPDHDEAAVAFLTRCGFAVIKRDWQSRLETADFDWTAYAGLEERIAESGIAIRRLSDLLQQDSQALYKVYDLHQTLNQEVPNPAPRTRVSFEYWRDGYSAANTAFIAAANYIAVHQGDYIGLSGIWGEAGSVVLYNGMTGVLPGYRRQGIATALKLRGIAYAQAQGHLPLITHNQSDNPMLQLNLKLGFRQQHADLMLMKRL